MDFRTAPLRDRISSHSTHCALQVTPDKSEDREVSITVRVLETRLSDTDSPRRDRAMARLQRLLPATLHESLATTPWFHHRFHHHRATPAATGECPCIAAKHN